MSKASRECVIYVRLSEDDEGDRLAVIRHADDCRALAERLGLTVTEVFEDNDLSATSGVRRPGFEAVLALPTGSVVLCWHPDRLIRLMSDLERVIARELVVHAVHAGAVDLSTPTGRAVARTITAWSQHEGEHRRQRQESALRQLRAAGKWSGGRRPLGYEVGMTAFREDEAQALRDAYAWLLEGVGLAEIARRWNARGLRSTQSGAPWKADWMAKPLRNPAYAGLRTHKGEIVGDAAWEPLVDRATWEAAQAILTAPDRRQRRYRRHNSLLASIARCGECGGLMHAGGNAARGGLYHCATNHHIAVKRAPVDDLVLSKAAAVVAEFEDLEAGRTGFVQGDGRVWALPERPTVAGSVPAESVRELEALEVRLDSLAADLALSERVLAQRTAAIEARITQLRQQVADAALSVEAPSQLEDVLPLGEHGTYREAFLAADLEGQRRVLSGLFDIRVSPPGRGARTFPSDKVQVDPRPGAWRLPGWHPSRGTAVAEVG